MPRNRTAALARFQTSLVLECSLAQSAKKETTRTLAEKFVDWMYGKEGQEAMTRSFMYSPLKGFAPPVGAPDLSKILAKSFPWSREFIDKVTSMRGQLKEKYTEIMFE